MSIDFDWNKAMSNFVKYLKAVTGGIFFVQPTINKIQEVVLMDYNDKQIDIFDNIPVIRAAELLTDAHVYFPELIKYDPPLYALSLDQLPYEPAYPLRLFILEKMSIVNDKTKEVMCSYSFEYIKELSQLPTSSNTH